MPEDKNRQTNEEEQEKAKKDLSEKTWEDDDDWMDDPSGINPGC